MRLSVLPCNIKLYTRLGLTVAISKQILVLTANTGTMGFAMFRTVLSVVPNLIGCTKQVKVWSAAKGLVQRLGQY